MPQRDNSKSCGVSLAAFNKILQQQKKTKSIKMNQKGKFWQKRKTKVSDEAILIEIKSDKDYQTPPPQYILI